MDPLVYRPTFVRVLSVITWVLLAVGLVITTVQDPVAGLYWAPVIAFIAVGVLALFWRPSVEVDDEAVTVRNLVRDTRIPWSRLDALDTRYSLTLFAGDLRVAAWAAPAPGRSQALRQSRSEAAALQSLGTNLQHGLRSSAVPHSDSGGASLMVQARWERARMAGPPPGEPPPVQRTWAVGVIVALVVTFAASVVSVLLG